MTTAQNDDASHDSLGEELRRLYPGIIEQAQPLDRQQLLAEHPELADELRRLFDRFDTRLAAAGDCASIGARTPAFRGNDLPTIGLAAAAELDPTTAGGAARKEPGPLRLRYFGDYELLFEIARGGMGVVYKARQLKLNRDVAVKMILAGQLASADDVSRFHVEAEAAAHLDHPGIVPVYEVGEHEGCHFFSMGFVEGTSLAAQLAQGPLEPSATAELMVDVCDAIQYAHEQGVIHRDLKPQNILLDKQGRPRVTDFGLAKRVAKDSGLTSDGAVLGTPNYMPPEQAAGHTDKIGPAADVYSLGAVLYTALTGRPPFQAATPVATVMQVIHREPAAPRQLNAVIPRDLETIALKCLEKDPARRYATAGELGNELRRFLAGEPILARPIGPAGRSWRWCRRHPHEASLAAVAALLIAVQLGAAAIRL
ncbi:MAG: serine/threonine-protein kinase, partial [Pirellulales bacterium]